MNGSQSPLLEAIDWDGWDYLNTHAPRYLVAVEGELRLGKTPEQIGSVVRRHAGSHREELAKRCEQAARHLLRVKEATA